MKRFAIFILLIFVVGIPKAWAQDWDSYASLYLSYFDFQNSPVKDNGWTTTGYLSLKNSYAHTLELGISQTEIDYKIGNDLSQTDFNIVYSNTDQILKNYIFKFGFHYINTDDELTDSGKIFYFQWKYYQTYNWNAGLEFAYSLYNSFSTTSGDDLNVFQVRPHFGYYFAFLGKRIYGESRLYFIHTNENVGTFDRNNFSFEQYFSTYIGLTDFKVSGWFGKQIFAVKNEGFVVYNLSDEYLGGFSFEVGHKITSKLRAAFNLSQEWLKHSGYNDNVSQTVITLSIGGSF
ncbi:hypothetical protein [Thermodesulfatator autotrophicus]|uniref:Uncharacterized protein n=1 Tax=Thermodesulfatator autotrophicus TaxID=1795632 RepID=A0A177EBM1_9BACT|nr:hypothetical protein [Thermodesulfatator autotrophicus]OAG28572.1 hypothetical protein TH606_01040 [Thermodesulfatator autotrophicus]